MSNLNDSRRATGQQGEAIARAYLERHSYGMIAANWRCALGELDLIMQHGPTLVFVEVRTRRSYLPGLAEASITPAKQRRLARLAQAYLQHLEAQRATWTGPWRVDVVALQLDASGNARVHHLQNVIEDIW